LPLDLTAPFGFAGTATLHIVNRVHTKRGTQRNAPTSASNASFYRDHTYVLRGTCDFFCRLSTTLPSLSRDGSPVTPPEQARACFGTSASHWCTHLCKCMRHSNSIVCCRLHHLSCERLRGAGVHGKHLWGLALLSHAKFSPCQRPRHLCIHDTSVSHFCAVYTQDLYTLYIQRISLRCVS
jgi:hypothetical protein